MIIFNKSNRTNIRNTCTVTLSIPSKEQINIDFEKTWNKRMVEVQCGIFSNTDNDFVWYKLGRLLMSSGTTKYNATTQEVKLKLVDLMASISKERGSQIGVSLKIPVGTNVRLAIVGLITEYAPYKKYNVCEFEEVIPYDIDTYVGDYLFRRYQQK